MTSASGCSDDSANKTSTFAVASTSPTLVAYGASPAAWDANHKADSQYTTDVTFEMKIKRPEHSVKYSDFVTEHDGRIDRYVVLFPPKTSLAAARRYVMRQEFPGDARASAFEVPIAGDYPASCALMTVRSKTLAEQMTPRAGGTVGVAFHSKDFESLNTADVWTASIHHDVFPEC